MTRGRLGRLVGLILATAPIGVWAFSAPQAQEIDKTIAGITVGTDTLDRVRALYGPGTRTTVDDGQSLCYYIAEDQAFLSVSTFERENRVRNVTLTAFADVAPGCRNTKIPGRLIALRGVRLGDPMSAVVGALGQPAENPEPRLGDQGFVQIDYHVAGGRATCLFQQNKLVLIGIEVG